MKQTQRIWQAYFEVVFEVVRVFTVAKSDNTPKIPRKIVSRFAKFFDQLDRSILYRLRYPTNLRAF